MSTAATLQSNLLTTMEYRYTMHVGPLNVASMSFEIETREHRGEATAKCLSGFETRIHSTPYVVRPNSS